MRLGQRVFQRCRRNLPENTVSVPSEARDRHRVFGHLSMVSAARRVCPGRAPLAGDSPQTYSKSASSPMPGGGCWPNLGVLWRMATTLRTTMPVINVIEAEDLHR